MEVVRYPHPEHGEREDDYQRFFEPWAKEIIKQLDVDFSIELHDTPNDYSEKKYLEKFHALNSIWLGVYVFSLNKELRNVVEEYHTIFNKQFYPHHIYIMSGNIRPFNFDNMFIELDHHPLYVRKDEAIAITKDFSEYLVKNYYRKRKQK